MNTKFMFVAAMGAAGLTLGFPGESQADPLATTDQSVWEANVADITSLGFADGELGQYGDADLAGDFTGFPGFPVDGPTDPDAATYQGTSLSLSNAHTDVTVTAENGFSNAFFLLDNPNDGNDVDATFGDGHGSGLDTESGERYLSFYGNPSTLVFEFDPGISAFAFESFDLVEGDIIVEWSEGPDTFLEFVESDPSSFFGVSDLTRTIDTVYIRTTTDQGVAISDFKTAVAVPSPTAALVGLPMLTAFGLIRRRRQTA